jgi:hypothetical protein
VATKRPIGKISGAHGGGAMTDFENLAYALDPTLLFKKAVGSDPDDWQAELLLAATTGDESKILALIGRQVGKSRVVSVAAAHHALFSPGSLTVVGSGSLGQSQELGRQIFSAIHAVDSDAVRQENLTRVELRSGSRVICLPASETVRGLSNAALVIVDEAQLVEAAMFAALEPMQAVAKNPKLIILGTCTSRATKFHEFYKSGDFKVFERRSDECPRISKQFLADKLKSLGPLLYGAEFENKWIDDGSQIVSDELLDAAIDNEYVPFQCRK